MSTQKKFALVASAAVTVMLSGAASALTLYPDIPPISDDFVLGPTTPGKWGDPTPGSGATVTYSFMPGGLRVDNGQTSVALSDFMPDGYKSEIVAAFDAWQGIANITFHEVNDPGVDWLDAQALTTDIRISGHVFGNSALAHGFFPPHNGFAAAGDIHFNSQSRWKIGFGGPGFDIFQVAAHEIGHAIGLDHEDDVIALMNPFYTQSFRGPQQDDIAGVQAIYGVRAISTVPLPPGLPLLGGAIILLGGLGRRRARSPVS